MFENPYVAPITNGDSSRAPKIPRARLSRGDASRILIVVGVLGGAALGSVGYLLLITFIELLLVPPFKSPPNYGQFMIVVMGVAFYMTIFGVALAAVPYIRWYGYIPVHLAGLLVIWAIDQQFFTEVDWNEAPIAARLLLYALPTLGALAVDIWWRRRAADPVSAASWNSDEPDDEGERADSPRIR